MVADASRHRAITDEIKRIGNGGSFSVQTFAFSELAAATKNFRTECLLGEGGFGRVYKGCLDKDNQVVAVKQLDRNGLQGNREFVVEVLMLSRLHHPNLVNLIGYCADGDQRILVYEYMALGSLEDHLLDLPPKKPALDWFTRMKIARGAAKGLEYLHDSASPPVIYRDFKASNILLDENFDPKLSDFGLAKHGPTGDKKHVSTRVMGTYGYCAPEYAMTGQLTTMSDVYSFGVVFLEIISGRRVIDSSRPMTEQNLVTWICILNQRNDPLKLVLRSGLRDYQSECPSCGPTLDRSPDENHIAQMIPTLKTKVEKICNFEKAQPLFKDRRRFVEMADPLLEGNYPLKGLHQALAVAAMCLQEEASTRPLISDVVTALEYLVVQDTALDESSKDPNHEGLTSLERRSSRSRSVSIKIDD